MPSLHPPLLLLLCALLPVPSISFCGHTDMEECYFRMYSPASGTVVGGAALLCAARASRTNAVPLARNEGI